MEQTLMDKLTILADSAKYDVCLHFQRGRPAPRARARWAAATPRAAATPLPPTAAASVCSRC